MIIMKNQSDAVNIVTEQYKTIVENQFKEKLRQF